MTTKATRDVLDVRVKPLNEVDIDGGYIKGTPIGNSNPSEGHFTNIVHKDPAENFIVNATRNINLPNYLENFEYDNTLFTRARAFSVIPNTYHQNNENLIIMIGLVLHNHRGGTIYIRKSRPPLMQVSNRYNPTDSFLVGGTGGGRSHWTQHSFLVPPLWYWIIVGSGSRGQRGFKIY